LPTRPLKAVILAAGEGKRMRSGLPKVLHPVAGRPILGYVIDAARALEPERLVVVVGHGAEQVTAYLGDGFTFVHQERQMGTGHALLTARGALGSEEADLLLLCGDLPLITPATLRSLVSEHRTTGAAATILTTRLADPTGYGRIIRDPATGGIRRIVEEADAGAGERAVKEVNTGIYCFRLPDVFPYLDELTADNLQGELYLVDLVGLLVRDGRQVATAGAPDPGEVEGVNDRLQLARAEAEMRSRLLAGLMESGVTAVDPGSTFVDWGVTVGRDTVLAPGTILRGRTRIGARCRIGPWTQLIDSVVGDDCQVWSSVVEESTIATGARVGPYSHLRPGSAVGSGARVGNFAEIKNSAIGDGAKVQHHSYIGDSTVGAGANIGAGTVVVNYDGVDKHRTEVGRGAFIGCNTNLVSPVAVGDGAYTAAGSTVTHDVPPGALAVARAKQRNLEGWVLRRRKGTTAGEAARAALEGRASRPEEKEPRTESGRGPEPAE